MLGNCKRNTCRILCGEKRGTGFLVSSTKVITATHTVLDCTCNGITNIKVEFGSECFQVSMLETGNPILPVAVLTLSKEADYSPISFLGREPKEFEAAVAYGFPSFSPDGYTLRMTVNTLFENAESDPNVLLDYSGHAIDFHGMSGAALMIDNAVGGILLRQGELGGEASVIYVLAGLKFRKCLLSYGISINIRQNEFSNNTDSIHLSCSQTREIRQLRGEINSRLDQRLDQIMQLRFSGREQAAWDQLIMELHSFCNSAADKCKIARYYLLAAIWAVQDCPDEVETYISKAIQMDPEIDTRIFESERAIQAKDLSYALEVLGDPDDIIILNQTVRVLDLLGKKKQALSILGNTVFPLNNASVLQIAILSMELGRYEEAHQHIDKLIVQYPEDERFQRLKGYMYFGQGIAEIAPAVLQGQLFIISPNRFLPGSKQQIYLQKAYERFETVLPRCQKDSDDREWVLAMLLIIATILPGKDTQFWLEKYKAEYPESASLMLYRIICRHPIPNEEAQHFLALEEKSEDYNYCQTKYALLLDRESFREAKTYFEAHETEIVSVSGIPAENYRFSLAIRMQDWGLGQKIAKAQNDSVIKTRMLLQIEVDAGQLSRKKAAKELIKFANQTKQVVDYFRAYHFCRQYQRWAECLQIAKSWYEVAPELLLLAYQVEALTNLRREQKALKLILRIEKSGYTSRMLLRFKTRCLFGLSRIEDAINLMDQIQIQEQDYDLVLTKAYSCIKHGMPDEAIVCLKDYADQGYKNKQVMKLLIGLLESQNLELALEYAVKYHKMYPEDEQAFVSAFHLDLLTGRGILKDECERFYFPTESKQSTVRSVTIDEFIKIREQTQKQTEDATHNYIHMKIPLCIYSDAVPSGNMGLQLYQQWKLEQSGTASAVCGGAANDIIVSEGASIVLDYTACISAIELGILDVVCEKWDCYISPSLLLLILREISDLRSSQTSQETKSIKLKDDLKKSGRLHIIQERSSSGNLYQFWYEAAKREDRLIVCSPPSNDFEADLPKDWESFCISEEIFCQYLAERGLMEISENITAETIKCDFNGNKFILGTQVLQQLSEKNLLTLVSDVLDVAVLSTQINIANAEADRFSIRRSASEWLDAVYKTINEKLKKKKLHTFDWLDERKQTSLRSELCMQEFKYTQKHKCYFWCDDRYFSRYGNPDCKIIGFTNVLRALFQSDSPVLRSKIDRVYQCHLGNLIPSNSYLLYHLGLCPVADTGRIQESTALRNIRDTICIALGTDFCLSQEVTDQNGLNERQIYLISLQALMHYALRMIWEHESHDVNWKCAAGTWLLENFTPFMCDLGNDQTRRLPMELSLTTYIFAGVVMKDNHEDYFNWIGGYLGLSWMCNPDSFLKVIHHIGNFIESLKKEQQQYVLDLLFMCYPGNYFSDALYDYIRKKKIRNPFLHLKLSGLDCGTRKLTDTQNSMFEYISSEDIDEREKALELILGQPEIVDDQFIERLEILLQNEKTIDMDFLTTIFWYVPDRFKDKIRDLYLRRILL